MPKPTKKQHSLTQAQLASIYKVTTRTLQNYKAAGAPIENWWCLVDWLDQHINEFKLSPEFLAVMESLRSLRHDPKPGPMAEIWVQNARQAIARGEKVKTPPKLPLWLAGYNAACAEFGKPEVTPNA